MKIKPIRWTEGDHLKGASVGTVDVGYVQHTSSGNLYAYCNKTDEELKPKTWEDGMSFIEQQWQEFLSSITEGE